MSAVEQADIDLLRAIYGLDWVGVGSRREGFAELEKALTPDFIARMSPEVGERELRGLADFAVFVQALEQDFDEFHYDPESFEERDGRIAVSGVVFGRGRASKMPLRSRFEHLWTVRDGRAVSVEAHLNLAPAEKGVQG
jgi:ketosteroid isomerase-like protein